MQVDHVRPDTREQLSGGLPADTAAHEAVLLQPLMVKPLPVPGNRVAEQHHLGCGGHFGILLFVNSVLGPVGIGLLPRLGSAAQYRRPAAARGHFDADSAPLGEIKPLVLVVPRRPVGVGPVGEDFQQRRPLYEGKVEGQFPLVPVGQGAYVPSIALAARHCHILPCLPFESPSLIPSGGHFGNEFKALALFFVIGRRVAKHGERSVEDDVLGQLTAAGPLRHSLRTHVAEITLGGIAHSSLRIVARPGDKAHEGDAHLVSNEINIVRLLALGVLQAVHALEVHHVGPGALESRWLESSVEIDHQVIARGGFGCTAVEINHGLVVAVHKVDLEALDAHR